MRQNQQRDLEAGRRGFRALQGSRHHGRDACRKIKAGLGSDPITGSRAAVGTAGSRLERQSGIGGRNGDDPEARIGRDKPTQAPALTREL
jgi:hypothetical protein